MEKKWTFKDFLKRNEQGSIKLTKSVYKDIYNVTIIFISN